MLEEDGIPHDFSLVTTDQLITELFKRHDAVLISVLRNMTDEHDEIETNFHCPAGGLTTILGLSLRMHDGLLEQAGINRKHK